MNIALSLTVALLPAILLLLYIWKKDPQKEPTGQLVKAVLWGVAICIPIGFVELGIQEVLFGGKMPTDLWSSTAQAFLLAAVPEEAAKLFALWLILRKNPYFDEHFDGIVYAVCVGLGFAAIENVMYLFSNSSDWFSVGIARAFLAVPGHYAFGVLMGYYYSMYHFVSRTSYNRIMILAAPIIAHGIYDTIAFSMGLSEGLASVMMVLLCVFCYYLQKNAQRKLTAHINRDNNPFSA